MQPPISELTLEDLLLARGNGHVSSKQIGETLVSMNTTAGRELRDSCSVVNPDHPEDLAFSMATLLGTPPKDRTVAQLEGVGIFVNATRRDQLRPEDISLLLSDEGLRLWLRFAAPPCAYSSVFVDPIMSGVLPRRPPETLARALRVLVACGRDTTNDVPTSDLRGTVHPPLSHLCSQVAPDWLPALLEFGSDVNQVTASGVPLIATAMAAQADRLHTHGQDLLTPHASLYRLGNVLKSHGAQLAQPANTGSQPVMLLALNGYCAAAEVLLSLGATCNAADVNRNGNTLMHHLAATARIKPYSFAAFYLLTLALRHGGDPDQSNHAGTTALSLLPKSLAQYLKIQRLLIAQARERAIHIIANPRQETAEEKNGTLPLVSAVMATQAKRLCDRGQDPLLPHESLFQLGVSLKQRGANFSQSHIDGTPPVLWLALRGYCGAAEVLLALHADCNMPRHEGNTLMHDLAAATLETSDAICADYLLNTALRYGGDPTVPNASGNTPLSLLSVQRARFVRAGFSFISQTRKRAELTVASRHAPVIHVPGETDSMRHSAASI